MASDYSVYHCGEDEEYRRGSVCYYQAQNLEGGTVDWHRQSKALAVGFPRLRMEYANSLIHVDESCCKHG